jgi:Domain of unknown function (DUF4124)
MPHTRSALVLRTLLAALLLSAAGGAFAQWKWRDASGKTQYSDIPPPAGIPEKDILQRPPGQRAPVVVRSLDAAAPASAPRAPAPAASAAPSKAEQEQQAKQKAEQEQLAKKQKEEERKVAEQRADNCKRATSSLRALEEGVRIARRNEAGETVFLDDRQRAEEIQRTRSIIGSDCR